MVKEKSVHTALLRLRTPISYALAFGCGIAVASVFWYGYNRQTIKDLSAQVKPLRQPHNSYQYINPLLGYQIPAQVQQFNEYIPLQQQIAAFINQNTSPNVENVSVYFRDLNQGRWAGVNEDMSYAPASMMKVVIMIAYFKAAESDPGLLQQQLQYSAVVASQIEDVPFETPSALKVGQDYSVLQLLEAMIINSDNGAKNALLDNIDANSLGSVYSDLSLPNPATTANYLISPKQYAAFLRILYNATYLTRDDSEKALQIMSQAKYTQGLVAGLSAGVQVAQKFGENVAGTLTAPEISLSNCGIIYQSKHPYILCIMTRGKDLNALSGAISGISKVVWQQVDSAAY